MGSEREKTGQSAHILPVPGGLFFVRKKAGAGLAKQDGGCYNHHL